MRITQKIDIFLAQIHDPQAKKLLTWFYRDMLQ